MPKRGKFIVLAGPEGSGKSALVKFLKEHLGEEEIIYSREPGGTEVAEAIRGVALRDYGEEVDVLTELFLFNAARNQHMVQKIRPALRSGKHVILDRFVESTWSIQMKAQGGLDRGLTPAFNQMNEWVIQGDAPDFYIFLDVPAKEGLIRKKQMKKAEINRLEGKDVVFHHQVRKGIVDFLNAQYPTRYARIDALLSQEKVHEQALAVIKERLSY